MSNPQPTINHPSLPLFLPTVVFLITVLSIEGIILHQTGRISYPLDDPYIHMAMARHFAADGVFGVSKAGFSATSSSPLWTLILGISFRLFGIRESIPLILNLILGGTLSLYLTRLFYERWPSRTGVFSALIFLFLLPLPTLTVLGMEHVLHIFLVLLLVEKISQILLDAKQPCPYPLLSLLIILAALTRYETVFVLVPLAMFFAIKRSWKGAVLLVSVCALPILLIGSINLVHGWNFFPNSIYLKSVLGEPGWSRAQSMFLRLYGQLFGAPHLVVPFVFSLAVLFPRWPKTGLAGERDLIWSGTFVMAILAHCTLASIGWFYRYEGYLLCLAAVALIPDLGKTITSLRLMFPTIQSTSERWCSRMLVLIFLFLAPVPFYKNFLSINHLVPGARNIYSQQYQMGLFLQRYYPGETIVANDIGAINFLADIVCLDYMGLGSMEPIRASQHNAWSSRLLHSWCVQKHAVIAVVYESWVRKTIPPDWIKVGEWTVKEKVTVADPTVSFFALNPMEENRLRANLQEFSSYLPSGVTQQLATKI